MKKIIIASLFALFLLGCLENETVIIDKKQEQDTETMLAGITGITANTVTAYPRWVKKDVLEIDFLAYKVMAKPVFGTAINLRYDPQVIEYASYKEGDFLERGSNYAGGQKPTYLASKADSSEAGKAELITGATLFRGTAGVSGSGRLLTLIFKSKQATPTQITITKGKLKGLQAGDIAGVNWPAAIPISAPPK